jgi:hypothetical protein
MRKDGVCFLLLLDARAPQIRLALIPPPIKPF